MDGRPADLGGVRLSRVLDAVGAKGTAVLATALNDYSGEIGMDLIGNPPGPARHPCRWQADAADKAPLWLIYPWTIIPNFLERDDLLWAWQLATIDVR